MADARSLLSRVRRLEAARAAPISPFEKAFGSLAEFEAQARAGVDAGQFDRLDMVGVNGDGGVLRAIRSWHEQGLFGMWHKDRVWELGR